jgi:thimet oligopeptidase
MEHGDVVTFLHEFGHMLHGMLSPAQRWAGVSGITTEWDFVEAPSQMLEEWVYDYDTLRRFARDAQGNPIPRELVAKMNAARYFDSGLGDMRQLALANISLRLHQSPAPADLGAEVRRLDGQYNMVPLIDGAQFQDAFGHLGGYSAVYYTYRWSKSPPKACATAPPPIAIAAWCLSRADRNRRRRWWRRFWDGRSAWMPTGRGWRRTSSRRRRA